MDFDRISKISHERALLWHPKGINSWSILDWCCAMAGEAGELCNAIKKLRRIDDRLQQAKGPANYDEAFVAIQQEVGDTYLYTDLAAIRVSLRMGQIVEEAKEIGVWERKLYPNMPWGRATCVLMSDVGAICDLAGDYQDIEEHIILPGAERPTRSIVRAQIAAHMASLVNELDSIAKRTGSSLNTCVVETFNRVSIREGFPQRL